MTNRHTLLNELLENDDFISWVLEPTAQSNAYWNAFATKSNQHAEAMEKARRLTLQLHDSYAAEEFSEATADDIWNKVEQSISAKQVSTIPLYRKKWLWSAAVITAVTFATFAYYSLYVNRQATTTPLSAKTNTPAFIERSNSGKADMVILLSDGSRVFLSSGSKLKNKPIFTDSTREVYLTGEAFFEVAKDPQHPFLVHANNVVTRVLGTSFRVNATSTANDVVVAVRTGKVAVFRENFNNNNLVLLPNQQVVINAAKNTVIKSEVHDTLLIKQPGYQPLSFEYEDAPILSVLNDLEKTYNIQINYNKEKITNCRITTSIGEESLATKIKIICSAINATYTINESSITIYSNGCE